MKANDHLIVGVGYTAADHQELRCETLHLIGRGLFVLALAALAGAVLDENLRQPGVWLVVFPLLGTAAATRLPPGPRMLLPSVTLIAGLGLSVIVAALIFPWSHAVYALPLLSIVASVLLGNLSSLIVAAITTGLALELTEQFPAAVPPDHLGMFLFLTWATCALSWLASQPTVTALDWAWRSYLLASQRTEELRDRQAELVQFAKSLNETCIRLEQLNAELDRARLAANEARRLKAEFAAMISHELRTPLNLIIGFSEMLDKPQGHSGPALPPRYLPVVDAIQRNASHLARLIDDVLDLSQIEAHRMALDKKWVALAPIVDEAVATIASLFEHLGLTITIDVPADLPLLHVDANRVRQILINLLNNAARFTDRGGVTIRVTRAGHDVLVAVTDTGVGIAPDDLPYVFQEFRQVGSTGRRRGGNGLGLAVCKHFIEMHGGSIWVESQLDRGSTFSFTLPIGTNVVTTPFGLAPLTVAGSARHLAVLGSEMEAKLFQRYLDGYDVIQAQNIAELRKLAAEHPLHAVVVCDQPSADKVSEAQESCADLRDVPVITCVLRASMPHPSGDEFSVNAYLVKPVSSESLLATIRRVAKGAREILIIEDDPEMVTLVKVLLGARMRRCHLRQAGDGIEALRLLRECRPDLVLLDRAIPLISGDEVLRQLRADPELREIPVIAISASAANEDVIRTSAFGISRRDGLTIGELMRCLRQSLDALLPNGPSDSAPEPRRELAT